MYPIYDANRKVVAHVLAVRETGESKYGDSVYYLWTLKVAKSVTLEVLAAGLRYALNEHCQHSYDCCGHWYRTVYPHTLRHTKRKEWTVTVVRTQNV